MEPDQPFTAPWQATAFALTVRLHEQGLFSWSEWADAFSPRLLAPDAAADGSDYYDRWVATLEQLLIERDVADPALIDALSDAWSDAAHATPHGQPIELGPDRPRADEA